MSYLFLSLSSVYFYIQFLTSILVVAFGFVCLRDYTRMIVIVIVISKTFDNLCLKLKRHCQLSVCDKRRCDVDICQNGHSVPRNFNILCGYSRSRNLHIFILLTQTFVFVSVVIYFHLFLMYVM